ncbi:FkbM family methyltransferase [Haladaptatus sp. ZSTT2]|uniref:FkbM family methyltransferase n=1 Tax=Haladaptatus sp. ZSTT2 TaxID=3120515 RepID=UPI00300EE118
MYENLFSPILDIWTAKRLRTEGYYQISPINPKIQEFQLWLPGNGAFQRKRMRGELEPEVLDLLVNHISPGDTVFDVGSAWGYFALAISTLDTDVYAFEIDEERVRHIEESAERSDLSVTATAGAVGTEILLDEYPTPDVVKMDIEGWEYKALVTAPNLLRAKPTLIIELHSPDVSLAGSHSAEISEIYTLLEEYGYDITELDKRGDNNYHILAQ